MVGAAWWELQGELQEGGLQKKCEREADFIDAYAGGRMWLCTGIWRFECSHRSIVWCIDDPMSSIMF